MTSKALDPIKAKTLKGNALRKYKKTITLNPTLREVIVGTLLGDASMPLKRGKPRPQGGKATIVLRSIRTNYCKG